MGTWGAGPFDSDLAGDFTDGLRGLASQQIINALEGALLRVAESGHRIDGGDEAEAVATAALVAAQIPGSKVVISPADGPDEPLPASLRASGSRSTSPHPWRRIRVGHGLGGQQRRDSMAPRGAADPPCTQLSRSPRVHGSHNLSQNPSFDSTGLLAGAPSGCSW